MTEKELISKIREGDMQAFEKAFSTYFKGLYNYAFHLVTDEKQAEEMVQQIFFKVWKNRSVLTIDTSLKGYLYKSVYHEAMQLLRSARYKAEHRMATLYGARNTINRDETSERVEYNELTAKFHIALNMLPEQCRTIFQLNRLEGLSYRQIADELGISIKTVESQMSKALKRLRVALADYLSEK